MPEPKRLNMINIYIPKELKDKVDNYWHENKFKSRAEAIRQLIERGLEQPK
jgi:metal-responsive CopG/Arc/MetJ family transcriptional regulator